MLIGDLIQRRARISPDAVFWREGGRIWRYGEMELAANRVARALLAEGLPQGSRIAIFAGGGPWYAAAHYAAAKAGLVLAHLNSRYTEPELTWTANHCGCALLFFDDARVETVAAARASLPGVRRWIALPPSDRAPSWSRPLEAWAEGQGGDPPLLPHPPSPEDPFQLLYTSGTTGDPKGALIGHRSKLRLGEAHALNMGLAFGDRILSALPLYHQFAQWLLLVAAPLVGAEVFALPRFDAGAYWDALARDGITHLPAVPTMLHRMLAAPPDAAPHGTERAPALRLIAYGGAPSPPHLIRRLRESFPGVRLFQGFGQTETGYCLGLHDGDHDGHMETLGIPDIRSEIRLLDEAGEEAAPGEVGEIVARTPYLMRGYLNDPEATAEYFRFGEDWGRTGDLAWRDEAGFYHLAGRRQEMIVSGGVNVYPAEVERALLAHPGVSEAAVFGMPHPDWGEAVTAAVILHEGAAVVQADLAAHCRDRLADFKRPKHIAIVADFPRTASGKVRKGALRADLE